MQLSGKTHKELLRRLHVIKDGKLHSGVKAFIILWNNIPKYRWLIQDNSITLDIPHICFSL